MKFRFVVLKIFVCFVAVLALAGCRRAPKVAAGGDMVPSAPEYSDERQWYIVDREADVDVFYVTSTNVVDCPSDAGVIHFADVSVDSIRALLTGEMEGIDRMYSGNFNFFSPYYRQCSLESFISDSLVAERVPLAMDDVKRAFRYYIEHLNNGRPFVLAGFSQGAIGVVEILKSMDDSAFARLVAAYVIGWKVTDEDLASTSHIVPAKDSDDVGVTVCFNSVRSPQCAIPLISAGNRLAINPVNWCTDGTPASLVARGDTLDVVLDTASLLLCVSGYSADDYMLPLIGREGNYHRLDITLYVDHLRRNIALRALRKLGK